MKLMDLQTIRSNLVENKNKKDMFNNIFQKTIAEDVPIKPVEIDWEYRNNSLNKTFYFSKVQI